ncbi:MAG: alpha amylase C-terminal domain-containing protein [Planctomycetaceae bacterium]|nr:alpha amylase C-terminal domain-containing protein [Planctomycetaceae bacterium]
MSTAFGQQIDQMGAVALENGVHFRVWAPHAEAVSVIGDFNNWDESCHPCENQEGYWNCFIDEAQVGSEYRFSILNGETRYQRIDPYAREVTNSVGNAIVTDSEFDWEGDSFSLPAHNELVIYEMHIGTFNRRSEDHPGQFEDVIRKLGYLKNLGINAIEVMPIAEFAGDWSWGYNPAHIFAIEQAYGGPKAFKEFVKAAHQHGIAVILDVVYNHFGPSDLDLWQFDGWQENGKGGIYFYNDHRSSTPWGETRPDYGRGEVRQFIFDNAMMWIEDYHVDGLRYDMTAYIRKVNGIDLSDIPEGWTLMQWINGSIAARYPGKLLVAEDLQGEEWLTKPADVGGAGFSAQWDANFVHPVRHVVEQIEDQYRNLDEIIGALLYRYNDDAFERVVYSESHDEVANGKARVPQEIDPECPDSREAQKRSVIAAGLALTSPGIPMLMQGQELLVDKWFEDTDPIDWQRSKEYSGIVRVYHDLITLRRNLRGNTKGLMGQNCRILWADHDCKLLAYHRWMDGGPNDDVVVVVNLANNPVQNYEIQFPGEGEWKLVLNSDWTGYSEAFDDFPVETILASTREESEYPSAAIAVGAYSIQVYSRVSQID